jgi:hypothetical protein
MRHQPAPARVQHEQLALPLPPALGLQPQLPPVVVRPSMVNVVVRDGPVSAFI